MIYLWFILGAILIVAEMFTSGFVLLWFGIGAVVAGLIALLGVGFAAQAIVFLTVSIVLMIASRTIFENLFFRTSPGRAVKSGVEGLPGQIGVVVSPSQGALNEAAVKVFGSVWKAYPAEGEQPLEEGQRVRVERVEGASIYVTRAERSLPWHENARLIE